MNYYFFKEVDFIQFKRKKYIALITFFALLFALTINAIAATGSKISAETINTINDEGSKFQIQQLMKM